MKKNTLALLQSEALELIRTGNNYQISEGNGMLKVINSILQENEEDVPILKVTRAENSNND